MKIRIFYLAQLCFLFSACNLISDRKSSRAEVDFINENFFSLVDSSIVYKFKDFYGSRTDSFPNNRDTLTASVWHELAPFGRHLSYLPNYFHKEKLDSFLTVLNDAIDKVNFAEIDFTRLSNIDRIKLLARNQIIKRKKIEGTIGDLTFYRVLFDKQQKRAITIVDFWTSPKSSRIVIYFFEKKQDKWVKLKEDILEVS